MSLVSAPAPSAPGMTTSACCLIASSARGGEQAVALRRLCVSSMGSGSLRVTVFHGMQAGCHLPSVVNLRNGEDKKHNQGQKASAWACMHWLIHLREFPTSAKRGCSSPVSHPLAFDVPDCECSLMAARGSPVGGSLSALQTLVAARPPPKQQSKALMST